MQAQERLTTLAHSLENLREEESRRLSRELHDVVGGNLASLSLQIQGLGGRGTEAGRGEAISSARALAEETLLTVRNLARALHPAMLEDLGLPNALATLANHTKKSAGLEVVVSVPQAWREMDAPRALCVYRFVREALTNALRHAQATGIEVSGEGQAATVSATVADNGRGFSPAQAPRGLGLKGMEERAALLGGSVAVTSAPGKGTTATLTLPPAKDTP